MLEVKNLLSTYSLYLVGFQSTGSVFCYELSSAIKKTKNPREKKITQNTRPIENDKRYNIHLSRRKKKIVFCVTSNDSSNYLLWSTVEIIKPAQRDHVCVSFILYFISYLVSIVSQ